MLKKEISAFTDNCIITSDYNINDNILDIKFYISEFENTFSLGTVLKNVNFKYYYDVLSMFNICRNDFLLFIKLNIPISFIQNYRSNRKVYCINERYNINSLTTLINIKYCKLEKGIHLDYFKVIDDSNLQYHEVYTKEYLCNLLSEQNIDSNEFFKLFKIIDNTQIYLNNNILTNIKKIIDGKCISKCITIVEHNPKFWVNNLYSLITISNIDILKTNCDYAKIRYLSKLLTLDISYCLKLYNTFGESWQEYLIKILQDRTWSSCKSLYIEPLSTEGYSSNKVANLLLASKDLTPDKVISILDFKDRLEIVSVDTTVDRFNTQDNILNLNLSTICNEDNCTLPLVGEFKKGHYTINISKKDKEELLKEHNLTNASIQLLTKSNTRKIELYVNNKFNMAGIICIVDNILNIQAYDFKVYNDKYMFILARLLFDISDFNELNIDGNLITREDCAKYVQN